MGKASSMNIIFFHTQCININSEKNKEHFLGYCNKMRIHTSKNNTTDGVFSFKLILYKKSYSSFDMTTGTQLHVMINQATRIVNTSC